MPKHPSTDDLPEDDGELELEPIDPEILEFERQRTKDKSRLAERAVDIDDIYADQTQPPLELDLAWFKQFRFTTRHLLIGTALASVLMTLATQLGACTTIFALAVVGVAIGWFLVLRHERRMQQERARRRAEVEARHAAEDAGEDYVPTFELPVAPSVSAAWLAAQEDERPPLDISFSLQEMFGAFTVAAVLLSVLAISSDLETMAVLLGFVALSGLAVTAFGLEPPRVVVLSWWLLLVMYLAVGIAAMLGFGQ